MRRSALWIALVCLPIGWAIAAEESATTQPTTTSAPAIRGADGSPVLAYCGTEEITQQQIDRLARVPTSGPAIPNDQLQQRRQQALAFLLRQKLYEAYAADHPGLVSEETVDGIVKQYEERYSQTGRTLEEMLKQYGMTMADFRKWAMASGVNQKLMEKAKDEKEIAAFYEANKAGFDGTKVTAKHVLIMVDEMLSQPQDWEKARAQVLQIKKDVEAGKMTFDEAVEKHSEDPGRFRGPTLPPFTRFRGMVEPFAAAAFALKPGEISEPIRTNYGYHIIQLVSREPGQAETLEQAKSTIGRFLVGQAHEKVTAEARSKHPIRVLMAYVKPPPRPRPTTMPLTSRPAVTTRITRPAAPNTGAKPHTTEGPPSGTPTAPPSP